MTTAVIADDERLLREQLRARLAEVWPALEIVAEAKNGAEAVALTEKHRPDIVFLDIRMPGMTGIEAARAIAQLPVDDDDAETSASGDGPPWHGPEIVFITAYDQYAIEAFEQGVVDYVLKPAERDRLQVTVDRVKKRLADRSAGEAPDASGMQQLLQKLTAKINPGAHTRLKWIQATVGASIQMIPVEDVLFFISDEKYTRVQTATLEALIRKPIKELVDELDADQFWQIHRSTLVNTRMIAGVTRDLRGRQLVAVRGHPGEARGEPELRGVVQGDVDAARVRARSAAAARNAISFARGSSTRFTSSSFISAMNRLGSAASIRRPRFLRLSTLTASVARARVMPTYIRRRSSSRRAALASSSSPANGSSPSLTLARITCGHSRPLAACSVDSVTTFWSSPRSARLMITEIVCATARTLCASSSSPVAADPLPPQRRAIQSTKSSTLAQRAVASAGDSSPSCRCSS